MTRAGPKPQAHRFIERMLDKGLITYDEGRYVITEKGRAVAALFRAEPAQLGERKVEAA